MKNFSISLLLLLTFSACTLPGTPGIKPVDAPRKNIEAVQIRSFAPQNVRLSNNKLFLWKENRTVSEIETAIRVSNKLEELDDAAFPLNKRQLELQNQVDPYDDQIRVVASQISKINSALTKAKKDRDAKNKDLNQAIIDRDHARAERDEEAAKPPEARDENKIKEKQAIIDLKQAQIDTLQPQIAALNSTIDLAQTDLAVQKNKKTALEQEVAPIKAELADVESKQADLSIQGEAEVAKITNSVDWYKDQPSSISFNFDGPTVNAEVRDWNLKFLNGDDNGEVPQNFTTDNGSIQNVTYTERAGEFKMTVYVYSKEKAADEIGALQSAAQFTTDIKSMQSQSEAYDSFRGVLDIVLAASTSNKVRKEAEDLKSVINPMNELTLKTLQILAQQFRSVLLERLRENDLVREYYTFTIRRARYDLFDRDGRVCFGGEFERHTIADGKTRKGVLKLVEGNNK